MYTFDPDGSKHRAAEDSCALFVIGCICAAVFIVAGTLAAFHYFQK